MANPTLDLLPQILNLLRILELLTEVLVFFPNLLRGVFDEFVFLLDLGI
jgi:hypothetical protein